MSNLLNLYVDRIIQDTYELERCVGGTVSERSAQGYMNNMEVCNLPSNEVSRQTDYLNLLVIVQSGIPLDWRPDLQVIRNFREELVRYRKSIGWKEKENSSLNRLSRIHLTED